LLAPTGLLLLLLLLASEVEAAVGAAAAADSTDPTRAAAVPLPPSLPLRPKPFFPAAGAAAVGAGLPFPLLLGAVCALLLSAPFVGSAVRRLLLLGVACLTALYSEILDMNIKQADTPCMMSRVTGVCMSNSTAVMCN
jgi:hypothetical protein